MKIFRTIFVLAIAITVIGCENEMDNYDSPNGGIRGRILDAETGEQIPLAVPGSGGSIINLMELNTNATKTVDFYAKADGTFENSKVFNCNYHIKVNGPFVEPCEGDININGQTTVDMHATPYSRIETNVSVTGHKVIIKYKVTPTNANFTVSEVYGYWNFAPGVDNSSANYSGKQTQKNTKEGSFEFNLDDQSAYTSNLFKIKANGNKLYFRVGSNINGNINYSTISEVVVN